METRQFLNQHQPQTLQIATMLLYINAVFAVLSIGLLSAGGIYALSEIAALAGAAAAYGMANDKKWGWQLALACAAVGALFALYLLSRPGNGFNDTINVMFRVATFAVVVHPLSRSYVKTWFK